MSEEKSVQAVKNNSKEIAVNDLYNMSDFMDGGLTLDDVRLEKLVTVQSNSKIREEFDSYKEGDMYLSVSRNRVLEQGTFIKFIPLYIKKLVQVFENKSKSDDPKLAQKGEYIETLNESDMPSEFEYVDKDFIRMKIKSVFCLVIGEGFSTVFPYRIDFKSSSMKNLNPLILKITEHIHAENGNTPMDLVFNLTTKKMKNDQASWYVPEVSFNSLADKEQKSLAIKGVELIKSLKDKALYDDSDLEYSIKKEDSESDDVPF